jgi:hypothetical protein
MSPPRPAVGGYVSTPRPAVHDAAGGTGGTEEGVRP